ncbi:MAG: GldM family protein [Bacteroidia bacterium]
MKKSILTLLIMALLASVSMTFSEYSGRIKQFNSKESYTIDEILGVKNLTVLYIGNDPQFDGDEYKVKSFNMLTVPKVGEAEAYSGLGDLFSENIKNGIKTSLKPGDKILIDNIMYDNHNGETKRCSPVAIIIK